MSVQERVGWPVHVVIEGCGACVVACGLTGVEARAKLTAQHAQTDCARFVALATRSEAPARLRKPPAMAIRARQYKNAINNGCGWMGLISHPFLIAVAAEFASYSFFFLPSLSLPPVSFPFPPLPSTCVHINPLLLQNSSVYK